MGKRAEQWINTRLAILAAFEKLCDESTYTRISVADICRVAGISKPTFYRHFQNKEDIIRWIAKQSLDGGVAEIGKTCSWREGYLRTLSIQYKHRSFFCDKQSVEVIGSLFDFSNRYRYNSIVEGIRNVTGAAPTEKHIFQIEALLIMEGFIDRRWAADGMRLAPAAMADYLASCVPHDLFKLLDNPTASDSVAGTAPDSAQHSTAEDAPISPIGEPTLAESDLLHRFDESMMEGFPDESVS